MLRNGEVNAHQRLSEQGYRIVVNSEHSKVANVDLLINKKLYELKTIHGKGSKINQRFNEAISKWERLHDAGEMPNSQPRVIIDNSHPDSTLSDDKARKSIIYNLKVHRKDGLKEVVLICRDGSIEKYY